MPKWSQRRLQVAIHNVYSLIAARYTAVSMSATSAPPATPATTESGAVAPAKIRVLAWLIDFLFVFGLGILFAWMGWAVSMAYWLLRDGLFDGQSVGKRLMRIRVIAGADEKPSGYVESILRNILWVVPVIQIAMGLTGLYLLMHDKQSQHWGDRLADTHVVVA